MLRSPVRSLGDRHAVPLVSAVRHALSYQSLSYPLSGESLRDAREREMQRLADLHRPATLVRSIQLGKDIEHRIELPTPTVHP